MSDNIPMAGEVEDLRPSNVRRPRGNTSGRARGNTSSNRPALEAHQPEQGKRQVEQDNIRLERDNELLRDSCRVLGQSVDYLQEQCSSNRDLNQKLDSDLQNAKQELKSVKKNLKEAQDLVFALQPVGSKITETEALNAYTALCENIETWVNTHLQPVLGNWDIVLGNNASRRSEGLLLGLLSRTGRLATRYPHTDTYNIMGAIIRYIGENIFDVFMYGAIDEQTMQVIYKVEANLTTLTPKRSLTAIRTWESETLHAVVNDAAFAQKRNDRAKHLASELTNILQILVPGDTLFRELAKSVFYNIIVPAITLCHKMQLSTDEFRFAFTAFGETYSSLLRPALSETEINEYDCIDSRDNGRPLCSPPPKEIRVIFLMDIFPAMIFGALNGDDFVPRTLIPPKVLVACCDDDSSSIYAAPARMDKPVTFMQCLDRKLMTVR